MADVFVSYTRADKARVQPLVTLLESKGLSVWWDTRISAGERWDELIEREIKSSRCVVVVWSSTSVSRHWVREEANYGRSHGILVQVRIDPVEIPIGYALIHTANMVGWVGRADDPVAESLVSAVRSKLDKVHEEPSAPSPNRDTGKSIHTPGSESRDKSLVHAIAQLFWWTQPIRRHWWILVVLTAGWGLALFYWPARPELEAARARAAVDACGIKFAIRCAKEGGIFGSDEALAGLRSCNASELYRSDNALLQWIDVWTTSVYSFAPGGGGPGGGLDDDVLKAGGWGDWYFTLIQFKLPPLPGRPTFAGIGLYSKTDQMASVRIEVDQIIRNWSFPKGDRLWWKDRPGARALTIEPLPAPKQDRWYLIDLTKLAQQWFEGKSENYGIQIRPASNFGSLVVFVSSDAADKSKIPYFISCF